MFKGLRCFLAGKLVDGLVEEAFRGKERTYEIFYDELAEKDEELKGLMVAIQESQKKLEAKEKKLMSLNIYLLEKAKELEKKELIVAYSEEIVEKFGGVERMKAYYFFARLLDGENPIFLMNQIEALKPQEQSLEKFFEENPDMAIVYKALSSARDL